MAERTIETQQLRAESLFSTDGFVCLVTGGGTGIGLMATQALAANGEFDLPSPLSSSCRSSEPAYAGISLLQIYAYIDFGAHALVLVSVIHC